MFGSLEAVFLWPLVLGLCWARANAAGAIAGMLAFLVGNLFGRAPDAALE